MNLDLFQVELQQLVRITADAEGEESSLASAFTKTALDILIDAGEANDPRVTEAVFESSRMQISAFDWDEERALLTFYVAHFTSKDEVPTLTKADLSRLFARLNRFAAACVKGLYRQIEESTDVFDTAQFVFDVWTHARAIRFVVLTNSLLRTTPPAPEEFEGHPARYEVWDLERLERLIGSGKTQEPVEVLTSDFGVDGLASIGPFEGKDYEAYLLVIPGKFLADVYEEFGPRLLELNVRSFLQARGKTNQGMQTTLKDDPSRFLAYNNGLSMTATSVERRKTSSGETVISRLIGLQIVNGGQTTASLYYASRKPGVDLSNVLVQAKLSILEDDARSSLAPLISRFANTQNLIRMADFSANDPFHVELEKLSRSIWAPAPEGSHEMTRWFYERSRGQFADAVGRERTPAQKRQFLLSHPRKQLFAKTDVAKYENAWRQLPFSVALGAEKNFNEFSQAMAESKQSTSPDAPYFQDLISKAILWKQTELLVNALKLGGYRSAVVAYTVALVSNRISMRLNLDQVWREQAVSPHWASSVNELAPLIHAKLISSAGSKNVLEWAKKKDCWAAVKEISWVAPSDLMIGAVASTSRSATAASQPETSLPASDDEIAGRALILSLGPEAWIGIAAWAKQTGNLQSWQRGLAFSIGSYLTQDRALSAKQVVQGVKIAVEVERLGFRMERPQLDAVSVK
ncbi:hypothetical protein GCM10007382_07730 [Salinibacterium xinjiangense]|uniref:AIPR protein n=1 Tax=Salinibacterium xinjiangense TaxID=386302 RepID=A0A2C8ZB64_9MICO|nr:AIPR family protein [Salinibacterium xinjiangense]GGK90143.1 hypothetical protein GCM10007382_07730 [Salinibacterium xinjiangense]SOE61389.1 AIPR protein [Salinibacterium xinjiangense]